MATLQRKFHLCTVFLEKELRGLSPNFHVLVSVSDLHIYSQDRTTQFSCSRIGRLIVGIYDSLTDTWMWKLGLRPRNSFSANISFEFSVLCLSLSTDLDPSSHSLDLARLLWLSCRNIRLQEGITLVYCSRLSINVFELYFCLQTFTVRARWKNTWKGGLTIRNSPR